MKRVYDMRKNIALENRKQPVVIEKENKFDD
jgi:hypothetical protein